VTEILERWEKEGHLSHRIELFNSHLRDIMDSYPRLFQQVTGRGLMVGLVASSKQIRDRIVTASMEEGVLVLKAGEKTVRFLPPLTITPEEIKEGFARLERAVEKVAKGGDS
jgi:acetylornithine aminotransferase